MREIKFRAWDKNRKGFINGFYMFGFSRGQGCPYKMLQRFNAEWKEEDFELMQYTGVKDKNGKEVYEGDYLFDEVQTWIVEFSFTFCGFHARDIHAKSCNIFSLYHLCNKHNDKREVEVIGNIYENASLLLKEEDIPY